MDQVCFNFTARLQTLEKDNGPKEEQTFGTRPTGEGPWTTTLLFYRI